MESQPDAGIDSVVNMEKVPITVGQEMQRSDEKRANGIGNGEMQRRVKNIPVLEERRLLALERHIKRKRRRRPYVKKVRSSDKTEHQLDKTVADPTRKKPGDPGRSDLENKRVKPSGGKGKADAIQNESKGISVAASDVPEEMPNKSQATNEPSENFEVQSTKMDVENGEKKNEQNFDKLVEYLVKRVKSEILKTVEYELESHGEGWKDEESQIQKDEVTGMEVKREENFSHVKELDTLQHKNAGIAAKHVNDEDLKREKEDFHDEGHEHEKAKGPGNKIEDIRGEKAEQSLNKSSTRPSTESKELKPGNPDLEATDTNQLIKHERYDGKNGLDVRTKLILDEDDGDDDENDDDGFMPRKLFFFSFSQFKKEETCA